MSDDDSDSYTTNQGITLPESANAIYNIGITPIFVNRAGVIDSVTLLNTGGRGLGVGYWVPMARWSTQAYYFGIKNDSKIYPSDRNPRNSYGFSLRCLVSTKRQASE